VRALVQRVTEARVRVDGEVVGEIGPGLCVLVGVTHDDDEAAATRLARKVWGVRVFDDAAGVMNAPVAEVGGQVLVVSQFTLYGDTSRGRRWHLGGLGRTCRSSRSTTDRSRCCSNPDATLRLCPGWAGQPLRMTTTLPSTMERLDSTHSIWVFDTERMRFRRLPKDADPAAPSLEADWQPYFALDVDTNKGTFTVALNEDRTRLLRAWRADRSPASDETTELGTGELHLEPSGERRSEG